MPHIHTIKFLPSAQAIQSVSGYSDKFKQKDMDFKALLTSLKKTVIKSRFISQQDNAHWATVHGVDYFNNPKLFAQAPLAYVCAFISEIFKNNEVEAISQHLPVSVLQLALQRLKFFVIDLT